MYLGQHRSIVGGLAEAYRGFEVVPGARPEGRRVFALGQRGGRGGAQPIFLGPPDPVTVRCKCQWVEIDLDG